MNRFAGLAVAAIASVASVALPASAQQYYSTEVIPPKIVKMGTHRSAVAGIGKVRVQVQVNPNGTHVVTRIISSTNHGDDAAAREIAQSSSYRPAMRGGKAVVYLYDPVFRFTAKSVAGVEEPGGPAAGGGVAAPGNASVEKLLLSGRYAAARNAAQAALARNPNDSLVQQQLGAADYYLKDYTSAVNAFDRAGAIGRMYRPLAAQSYASAAVAVSDSNPTQALTYAQKAVSLDRGANSRFALGVAQLANKQYSQATATLRGVHATVFGDPKTPASTKYGIDQRLLTAYVQSGNTTGMQSTINEMKQLQPGNPYPAEILINQGNDATQAKNYTQAIALYDAAASFGDRKMSVIAYDRAANAIAAQNKPGSSSPDAAQMKGYADKALALDPNDAAANFFEGYASALQYNTSHTPQDKQQALNYLNKADTLAKSGNQASLETAIQNLLKQLNGAAGGGGMP
jgi:tetratricopeptide (TPR) repeat protein